MKRPLRRSEKIWIRNSSVISWKAYQDFFIQKIIIIREELDDYPRYHPSDSNLPKFSSFNEICQDQVQKMIISTKSKSCELDSIPMTLLKGILPGVLPAIKKLSTYPCNLDYFLGNGKQQWSLPY